MLLLCIFYKGTTQNILATAHQQRLHCGVSFSMGKNLFHSYAVQAIFYLHVCEIDSFETRLWTDVHSCLCNRILVNFMAYVDCGTCDCLVWYVWHTCHSNQGLLLALRISFVFSSSANPHTHGLHIATHLWPETQSPLITSTAITARGNIINIDWFDGLRLLPLYLRWCQYSQHTVSVTFTSWEDLVENSWGWEDVCWYL